MRSEDRLLGPQPGTQGNRAKRVTLCPGLSILESMTRPFPPLHLILKASFWSCVLLISSVVHSAEKPAEKGKEDAGAWLKLPADGTPWGHQSTGLRFPQVLGQFSLSSVFRDARPEAGVAVTYVRQGSDLKASVVIFPCSHDVSLGRDVDAIVRKEHANLVNDLQAAARQGGYAEKQRSPLSEEALQLWNNGKVPMTVQTIEMVPMDSKAKPSLPVINHWIALLLYKDHFVQLSVVIPGPEIQKDKEQVDELITKLLQCIREPALKDEMLQLCQKYMTNPLSKEGREAADTLLAFSKASPVFEIILPGEALTTVLNEVSAMSPEASLDLLRSFIVGSSVVALQGGSADESLEEGARMFISVAAHFHKSDERYRLPFFVELTEAQKQKRTAAFLKERMQPAKKP